MEGEIKLILSIIGQAAIDSKMDCLKIKDKKQRIRAVELKRQALYWMNSNSTNIKSFNFYCSLLDINPSWARRKIKENNNIFTNLLESEASND